VTDILQPVGIPGPSASASSRGPLPSLAAVCAARRRDAGLGSPRMCVGAPARRRSAAATSSGVAWATGTTVTSYPARKPSAMLLATRRVFPNIDS
jgi:hypothetical protein